MGVDVRSQQDKMRTVLNHRARLPPPPAADAEACEDGTYRALGVETARWATDSLGGARRDNAGTAASGRRDEQSRAEADALLPHKPLGRLIHKFSPQVRAISSISRALCHDFFTTAVSFELASHVRDFD